MKAIIYARFSPRPNASECDSIEKQVVRCTAYCTSQEYDLIGTFQDADMSGGRADNRPGLQDALKLACEHKAVLVCYDLSRLARNTRDAISIADKLQKAGANLAFLDLKIDTSSPTGRCFFTILAAFAQLYREQISDRTSLAMLAHQKNGRCMSRHAPYGHQITVEYVGDNEVKKLVENEEEQLIIRYMCDLNSKGMNVRDILNKLTADGVKCRGGKWHYPTVKNILKRHGVEV